MRFARQFTQAALAISMASLLCHCETLKPERTVTTRKSSVAFAEDVAKRDANAAPQKRGLFGRKKAPKAESQVIGGKLSEAPMSGFTRTAEGNYVPTNRNLYAGEKAKGIDGKFDKKQAKFKKMEAETKAFKTPEYLKMQEYAGVKTAREAGTAAKEADSKAKESGKLFDSKTESSKDLDQFSTNTFAGADDAFSTSADRIGSDALSNSATAVGLRQQTGYKSNARLSMDDVKKMVNPGSYRPSN